MDKNPFTIIARKEYYIIFFFDKIFPQSKYICGYIFIPQVLNSLINSVKWTRCD